LLFSSQGVRPDRGGATTSHRSFLAPASAFPPFAQPFSNSLRPLPQRAVWGCFGTLRPTLSRAWILQFDLRISKGSASANGSFSISSPDPSTFSTAPISRGEPALRSTAGCHPAPLASQPRRRRRPAFPLPKAKRVARRPRFFISQQKGTRAGPFPI